MKVACALMVAVAACSPEVAPMSPLPAPSPSPTPSEPVTTDAGVAQAPAYEPTRAGAPRRDPFASYADDTIACFGGPLSALQRVDLDKLKLTSVVIGQAVPMAQVEGPDGVGHTLKVGTLIGRHLGQVTAIRRGVVVITEETRDFTGRRIPHRVELKLASP